jgi:hypothetical protein
MPEVASAQLFARGLEYRLRGPGTAEEAEATLGALSGLADLASLEPEDVALRAFLMAEAEDVVRPGGGEVLLRECLGAVGLQALVALGLAERALAKERVEEAVRFFGDAVYGNLLGLRRPGRVALAAAGAAERSGEADSALRFLNEAAKDPDTRTEALRRLAQFSFATSDVSRARSMLRGLADSLEGSEKAEVLAQLARALFDSKVAAERLEADRTLREAIASASAELAGTLLAQLGQYRSRPPPPLAPPSSSSSSMSSRPPIVAERSLPTPPPGWPQALPEDPPAEPREVAVIGARAIAPPPLAARVEDPASAPPPTGGSGAPEGTPDDPASRSSAPPRSTVALTLPAPALEPGVPPSQPSASAEPGHMEVLEARRRLAEGLREAAEKLLGEALREGSVTAADELDALLSADPARAASLLKVRRQAVELRPGDLRRLTALRDAARADKNPNYVRALEHVLHAFEPQGGRPAPPPLSAQQTQPGMLTLLTRHSRELLGEAFGVVWTGASGLFAKAPTAYRMTGLERVAPGPIGTLSRLYEAALRLLDTPRFALFHRRGEGPLTLTVALLQNPSAILGGEAKEDRPDVRWLLGHALASVLAQNALPLGLPEAEGRLLWESLVGAFGPPGRVKTERAHANLAEMLWQTLAPRAQRRLKELLGGEDDPTPFELVVERANQSGRRVGMFLTGDFAHAARTVVGEHAALDPAELGRPGGLAKLCSELPSLADLYRLAVRPEYADARWYVPPPQSSRFPFGAGGLPPV